MSNLLKVSDELQQQMLSELCARNQACELVFNSSEGKKVKAKVRFLHLSGQRILIDLPMVAGRVVMIRPGEVIQLYFLWQGQRFVATSIIQARMQWQEGQAKALETLAIQYPYEIERAQRRECYRLSLTHLPAATIALDWSGELNDSEPPQELWRDPASTPSESQKADPDQPKSLKGRMTNLSETGCLAIFKKGEAPPFERGQFYNATFLLPDHPEPFHMTAEIRWSHEHPAGDRVMTGMAWQLDPNDRAHRGIQTSIAKFITDEQRAALRRARID